MAVKFYEANGDFFVGWLLIVRFHIFKQKKKDKKKKQCVEKSILKFSRSLTRGMHDRPVGVVS